ncbi:MAG: tetratricopeptide repeat protein [Phycisphaerae bacterium]|nr:tetratricopeptide repeat protein [Phycisphaerae bacterium]MDW8262673.1 tetratricopeptide repeat protein [Phycisphaerales bacterium]
MDAAATGRLVQQAIEQLQQARPGDAERLLRQVLAMHPDHPDALHYLGVAALQSGRAAEAAELIQRSLQISPGFAAFNNLATAFRVLNRPDEAIACLDRSIQLNPNHPDALWNLGTLLAARGQHEPAVRAFTRLLQLQPRHPKAHFLLGSSLAELSYLERSVHAFRAHLQLQPDHVEAWGRLSAALSRLERHEEAIAAARKAAELCPDLPEAHNHLGWVLDRAGRLTEAEAAYRRAIQLNPRFVMALGNLAAHLEKTDRLDESCAMFERAVAADPTHLEALCSLAGSYSRCGRYAEALEVAEKALAINPHSASARGHRALALLSFGRYEEGFAEYEWRWKCKDFTTPERDFEQPRWRGSDPSGRTILIHCEQGYGDNIQFARYLPMLAERGATVILECPVALRRLLSHVRGVSKVIAAGLRPPPFDLQAPLLSLPHVFGTTLATVPAEVPYLHVPQEVTEAWRGRLAARLGRFNVGLIWRGNAKPNPKRSIPLRELAPLASVSNVTFVSLQVGQQGEEASCPPPGMTLIDLRNELTDFLDTAAVMQLLDLIITIDSGGAHLAGALGRPTWTMLIKVADWRWLHDREDSPWYPTMRLFRQTHADDWHDVVARVACELAARVNALA